MKYYSGPIIFLLILFVLGAAAGAVTQGKYAEAQQRLNLAQSSLEESEKTLTTRKAQLEAALRNSPGEIGSTLGEIARAVGVLSNRRPTPRRDDYPLGSTTIPVQMVSYSVNGDYRLAMEWLGKVEDRFPFARIESVVMTGAGVNEVELLLNMAFPLEMGGSK
jgi:hypothetical protein